MDEYLAGYLLASLDPVTHKRLELQLRTDPELRARLELMRQAMAPLAEDAGEIEPPPGLALAALGRVAEYRCALPTAPTASPHQLAASTRWFRRIDGLVAAVLLLLIGGIATPALLGQWRHAQRLACADNLRQFHASLTAYADIHHDAYPRVESQGPRSVAGIFMPTLTDSGLARNVSVNCPARGKRPPLNYTVAELETMARETPEQFEAIASQLAGHYAYCLGYEQDGRLCGLKRTSGDTLPILADCADTGGGNSINHGGGQNVLFVGGNVRWCTQPTVGVENDHIYLNQRRVIQAGIRQSDTVLGGSGARPFAGE